MPLSRFIADLDDLVNVFNGNHAPSSRSFENLRVAVARMNEIRRQLSIAQEKLSASLAIAESELIGGAEEGPAPPVERDPGERFQVHDFCRTGIEAIDDEHHTLMRLGNRLYAMSFSDEVERSEIDAVLAELVGFAKGHFEEEERLMAERGFPGLESHRATHQRMAHYLGEISELARETPLLVTIRLEIFLGSWFIWHMQRDDAEFARFCLE
jgi:hemerythrin